METRKKVTSEFGRNVIKVLKCIVADQYMTLRDGESHFWESKAMAEGDLTITTITKDKDVVAKYIYNHETSEEVEFLY